MRVRKAWKWPYLTMACKTPADTSTQVYGTEGGGDGHVR